LLQPLDDVPKLWVARGPVIVPQTLFRIAASARDGEVLEIVSAPVVFRDDVLECRPVDRGSVHANHELPLAVDTPAFEDGLAIELFGFERAISPSDLEELSLLAA